MRGIKRYAEQSGFPAACGLLRRRGDRGADALGQVGAFSQRDSGHGGCGLGQRFARKDKDHVHVLRLFGVVQNHAAVLSGGGRDIPNARGDVAGDGVLASSVLSGSSG